MRKAPRNRPLHGYPNVLAQLALIATLSTVPAAAQEQALRSLHVERLWSPTVVFATSLSTRKGEGPANRAFARAVGDKVERGLSTMGGAVDIEYVGSTPLVIVTVPSLEANHARELLRSFLLESPPDSVSSVFVDAEQRRHDFVAGSPREGFRAEWEQFLAVSENPSSDPGAPSAAGSTSLRPWVWVEVSEQDTSKLDSLGVPHVTASEGRPGQDSTPNHPERSAERDRSEDPPTLVSRTVQAEVVTTWIGDAYSLPGATYRDRENLALALELILEGDRDRSLFEYASSVDAEGRVRVWIAVDPESAQDWAARMDHLLSSVLAHDATESSGLARRLRTRWAVTAASPRAGAISAARALLLGRPESEAASAGSGTLPNGGPLFSAQQAVRQIGAHTRLVFGPPS